MAPMAVAQVATALMNSDGERAADIDSETLSWFCTGVLMVAGLSFLGLIQLGVYVRGCFRALRTILHARTQEPEADPVALDNAEGNVDNDQGENQDDAEPQVNEAIRLRTQRQRNKKMIGVTDVNTIRGRNGNPRAHVKQTHQNGGCIHLLQSQSPLIALLEVDISEAGLCRTCHRR